LRPEEKGWGVEGREMGRVEEFPRGRVLTKVDFAGKLLTLGVGAVSDTTTAWMEQRRSRKEGGGQYRCSTSAGITPEAVVGGGDLALLST
jgi:hypothetical protein